MTSMVHLAGSALSNARAALRELRADVADRAHLTQQSAFAEPGDLAILTTEECLDLLGGKAVGRLAYVARAGTPDMVPVNYALEDGDILIRSGPGPKLQAAQRGERVAFEVDQLDDRAHSGWSVVVVGVASQLPSERVTGPDPWASGPRRHTIRVRPERITGRRLL